MGAKTLNRHLPQRRLGRTDLSISVIGFGGAPLGETVPTMPMDVGVNLVRFAFKQGINYFDTARSYNDSEEKIGAALQDLRDECIIATKVPKKTRREVEVSLEQSLRKLRTDRIDLAQIHGVNDQYALQSMMKPDGALEALKEAQREGKVDFIGVTGHRPHILVEAIKTGEFDTVQTPLNVITRTSLDELIPLAKEMDVGVVIMKPFGGAPEYHDGSEEFRSLLGKDKVTIARRALAFVLAKEISTVIPGFTTLEEVEAAVSAALKFDARQVEECYQFWHESKEGFCRESGFSPARVTCGRCLPCARLLDIPNILRYDQYYEYGLKRWAQDRYQRLPTRVDDCDECGECEQRCPYNLPVIDMLKKAHSRLKRTKWANTCNR